MNNYALTYNTGKLVSIFLRCETSFYVLQLPDLSNIGLHFMNLYLVY